MAGDLTYHSAPRQIPSRLMSSPSSGVISLRMTERPLAEVYEVVRREGEERLGSSPPPQILARGESAVVGVTSPPAAAQNDRGTEALAQ